MRVIGGRIHIGQKLMKLWHPGRASKEFENPKFRGVKEANQGDEVAVAIQGPTVGRHIEELDEFYVDVPAHTQRLKKLMTLSSKKFSTSWLDYTERDHFWGR